MFNNQKGFTLIELMVVVVIIGILAAIALPNFLSMQDRAKESEVKSNAHTTQLSVEDFKTQSNGMKPDAQGSFANAPTVANSTCGIPANLKNPFLTSLTGQQVINYANSATAAGNAYSAPTANTANSGNIQYVLAGNSQANPYTIYGFGKTMNYVASLTEGQ